MRIFRDRTRSVRVALALTVAGSALTIAPSSAGANVADAAPDSVPCASYTDIAEAFRYDSDGDNVNDDVELFIGETDPCSAASTPFPCIGPGPGDDPKYYDKPHPGYNPMFTDWDQDNVTDYDEIVAGTDPCGGAIAPAVIVAVVAPAAGWVATPTGCKYPAGLRADRGITCGPRDDYRRHHRTYPLPDRPKADHCSYRDRRPMCKPTDSPTSGTPTSGMPTSGKPTGGDTKPGWSNPVNYRPTPATNIPSWCTDENVHLSPESEVECSLLRGGHDGRGHFTKTAGKQVDVYKMLPSMRML